MKRVLKENFPEKICPVCNLKFKWRKKWKKNWENIIYCSKKCRRKKL
ncbi:MAG: DUF2256 domain-containing protein [Candidatus Marivariicella sp.]|nr:hypothetical protein [Flavobacteriaceae bacterium]MBU78806.1 hypothetical protein [Flavobacteriales bacterium]OUV50233.1 MAG: hypothetical protein CBC76_02640 [Flavobacteriaceae bacterium TMED116]